MPDRSPASPLDAVAALLAAVAAGTVLPVPAERVRLREAAGLTEAAVAQALGVRVPSIQAWEAGRAEPAGERLEAYRQLLDGLATRFPAQAPTPAPEPAPAPRADTVPRKAATPARAVPSRSAQQRPDRDPRFANGPLLVLDGDGCAYGEGGLVLDCPAATVPALVAWTVDQARIGTPRLHASGKDGDPLVVLTATALERLGLPERLEDRRALRLPENHPVIKQLAKAGWKLTKRGFGPWARIYRPVDGGRRVCVQLALLPWDALDARAWGEDAGTLPAPDVAKLLTDYATRVLTPLGSPAVCGSELMSALRPPTRAVQGPDGGWRSGGLPGSLVVAVDPAPPEPPDEHPLAVGRGQGPDEVLDEEAFEWVRDPETLSDAECARPWAVGIDVNMAFAAAANRLRVGLGEAVRVQAPRFDKDLPGSWLIDLSEVALDPRLPSPFTPHGSTPAGPAWYTTPTVGYAHELVRLLGLPVRLEPIEGWLRPTEEQLHALVREHGARVPAAAWESGELEQLQRLGLEGVLEDERRQRALEFLGTVPRFDNGPYLDPWYKRLRDAYVATMAELGVTAELTPPQFLAAMEGHKQVDPGQAAVLSAIKATVKGGIGKLRERPQGAKHKPGEPWPALRRPSWRPDIRAAVIASARVNMHRKIMALALKADLYPIAVLSDCAVYPSAGPSPLDFLPHAADGKPLPGGFRLGVSPGMVKHEGTQALLGWAVPLMDQGHNPARHIKGGGHDAFLDGE
ncbi:helix-turn-helix domain-containing protein [Streptacidiphilus sp. N1-3]|uniref:Helix-turn-helix domain-containing protein n=1 Tax=Streptacidiphilus alkalitolerans TaxID=3342712 RepID=A0ABV6XCB6_9ACTN